jgi:hypothetical protein
MPAGGKGRKRVVKKKPIPTPVKKKVTKNAPVKKK